MKKVLFSLLILLSIFMIVGCSKKEENVETKSKVEIKTTLSCSHMFTLFHSKQLVKYVVYLDKDNKLVKFDASETYSAFDEGFYQQTCDGLSDEAENDTKLYDYLNSKTECTGSEVIYLNEYDISKMDSKGPLPTDHVKDYLDDDFVLDLEKYKTTMADKSYVCEEL